MAVKISSFYISIPFLVTLLSVLYLCSFYTNVWETKVGDIITDAKGDKEDHGHFQHRQASQEKLQSSLFDPKIDKQSCLSKFEASLYRKNPPRKPSPYLISKLRAYEALHKRCGPNTQPYNETLKKLQLDSYIGPSSDCNYVVCLSSSGLGNRVLSTTAAFLYALLTNRVLLVDFGNEMSDLFCEPFPNTSWLLPENFPITMRSQFNRMDTKYPQSLGNMIGNNNMTYDPTNNNDQTSFPSYLYLHLIHDYVHLDKLFFCDDYQRLLPKVPWLLLRSNKYFVPSFFLMPSFEQELSEMFPEKETVFHHLGKYLFNPTNHVWGLVKRYYHAYLARADEIMGIQVRTFERQQVFFQHVMDQIKACATKENLLPQVVENNYTNNSQQSTSPKTKAVLITSLTAGYFENLKELYWQNSAQNGDVVGFYQPSHEELQHTEKQSHNSKAWAEMYLLSLVDVLITSGWSTFGYVAHGLGGLRPWILPQAVKQTVPDPPCLLVGSLEPCFLDAPTYDCKAKKDADIGALVPHVRHCEDMITGLKVVDDSYQ